MSSVRHDPASGRQMELDRLGTGSVILQPGEPCPTRTQWRFPVLGE